MSEDPILTEAKGYSIMTLKKGGSEIDLFVRRYGGRGGDLSYFQWMTSGTHPYLSQREVENTIDNPLGKVALPDGKKSRKELVPGDVLKVYGWDGKRKATEFEYVRTV